MSKIINHIDVSASNWFNLLNWFLIVTCLILVLISCFIFKEDSINNIEVLDAICNDCNTCTNDYLVNDLYCTSRLKTNNSTCNSDLCFNHSKCIPTCNTGKCVGPVECCHGHCLTNNDCPNLTSITGQITKQCIGQWETCVYNLVYTGTSDCLSLIADTELRNCLDFVYEAGVELTGFCEYNYLCAPKYAGVTIFTLVNTTVNITIFND